MPSVGWKWPASRQSSFLFRIGIAEIELVRTDDVALRADAEQLALDRIEVVLRVELLGEDGVERLGEPFARAAAVDRQVLVAVGNPDVGDAGRAERLAERGADLAAGDAVLDPELADAFVGAGKA